MAELNDEKLYELLLEAGKSITSEVEMEKLVQRITDIGTEASGAQFGAFFYNVLNQAGESYVLYTISGVPREAFSKFPMPRNTDIFHPTFAGLGTVRYDDVKQESHYGKMAPHFGMPKGHLPVTSYLATSVISPVTKEVIGGLFFGHSEPGVFTERSEKLIEGIAAQAAIAMGNARLFEERKRTEMLLQEQREQYRSIFQSTSDAMLIFDEAGHVVEANMASLNLLGYSPDELLRLDGRTLFQSSEQLFDGILGIVHSGRSFQGLGKIHTKRGEQIDVKLVVTSYLHKGSTHLLFVVKQLDGDKMIEEALVKTEAFAQTIANVSPVTLWMTDERAEMVYVNQTWMDIVGGTAEEHLGTGWLKAVHPDDLEAMQNSFRDFFRARQVYSVDFRLKRKDGTMRWVSGYGTPYYLTDGTFGGYAGSLTDITERKNAEQQLESQNTLINTITNNTMQALFLMDDRQFCTYMNPAAELMTGYRLHEVQDKPLHYYVHHTHPDGRHFPLEDCAIDRALPTRMQTTGEEVFIRKNGEFFPVAFVASPIIENGVPKGTVIEVRETTEEKRIEEELRNKEKEAMAMLEEKVRERTEALEKMNYELLQFTSIASHDLKEPVRKVAIFSQMAKQAAKDFPDERFQGHMDNIIRTSKRMAGLIDDLLGFARLSQTEQHMQPVDLNVVVQHITDDLQLAISEKEGQVEIEQLPTVRGVEVQLGQVFQNLISNSLKFSDSSRPPHIHIRAVQQDGKHIIYYSDNGIGFEEGMSDKIFEIFERLHTKEQYEGTGIGLAIVKKIVLLHGGTITASGTEGAGSQFVITLPQ